MLFARVEPFEVQVQSQRIFTDLKSYAKIFKEESYHVLVCSLGTLVRFFISNSVMDLPHKKIIICKRITEFREANSNSTNHSKL